MKLVVFKYVIMSACHMVSETLNTNIYSLTEHDAIGNVQLLLLCSCTEGISCLQTILRFAIKFLFEVLLMCSVGTEMYRKREVNARFDNPGRVVMCDVCCVIHIFSSLVRFVVLITYLLRKFS
jgi:hypothetical protein